MSGLSHGGDIPTEELKLRLPGMEASTVITKGGVYVPINVGRVRTVQGLSERVKQMVKDGLGEDFSGNIRVGAIRGVVPKNVSQLLIFSMDNALGSHDVHIDVPRNRK